MIRAVATICLWLVVVSQAAAQQTALAEAQLNSAEIEVSQLVEVLGLKPGMKVTDMGAALGGREAPLGG